MNLRDRLAMLLASTQAQTLASFAPQALVASVAGVALGAAVVAPAAAATGLDAVLASLGANLVSSMIYDIVKPAGDDESRAKAIQQGLAANDPRVVALVADTLAATAPEIAHALPDAGRATLVDALEAGMGTSSAALAAIAPQFGAALRNMQTDWARAQPALSTAVKQITMSMEAGEGSRISDSTQRSAPTGGSVSMTMRATGKGVIEGSSQIVGDAGGAAGTGAGRAGPSGDLQHQRELLAATIARLQIRELQRAQYGIDVPPHIPAEIQDLRAEVEQLRTAIGI